MAPDPVIRLRGIGKAYDLVTGPGNIFTRYLLSRAHSILRSESLWAVRGVDLEVAPASILGLIGANGSGKSTLLRLIAGITRPTEGAVEVRGRVVAMLEVGLGFHEELTGFENVYLHGSVLGLTRAEVERRLPQIIEFAELHTFMGTPVKHFSTGMRARLGFAVAVHSDPDIVLVDEVLAVGDGAFQSKCLDRMRELHAQGKTVIIVTHNIRHAHKLCDRILWLDRGRPHMLGPADDVARAYRRAACERVLIAASAGGNGQSPVTLAGTRLTGADGRARARFAFGEAMTIAVSGTATAPVEAPDLRLVIVRGDYEIVATANARAADTAPARLEGEFVWSVRWAEVFLNTGDYTVGIAVLGAEGQVLASAPQAAAFHVDAQHMVDPEVIADLPCAFAMSR